jgi:hypothetical protein
MTSAQKGNAVYRIVGFMIVLSCQLFRLLIGFKDLVPRIALPQSSYCFKNASCCEIVLLKISSVERHFMPSTFSALDVSTSEAFSNGGVHPSLTSGNSDLMNDTTRCLVSGQQELSRLLFRRNRSGFEMSIRNISYVDHDRRELRLVGLQRTPKESVDPADVCGRILDEAVA